MNLAVSIAALVCLLTSETAKAELLRLLSPDRPGYKPLRVNWALVALLVSLLLLVAMEPEARVFLMFIDSVGMDFFLLMLACQFRANVWLVRDNLAIPLWRRFRTWAPFPMDIPTTRVVKEFPVLSACAMAGMMMSVGFLLVMSVPFVLGVAIAS